jgi:hypothetical protein
MFNACLSHLRTHVFCIIFIYFTHILHIHIFYVFSKRIFYALFLYSIIPRLIARFPTAGSYNTTSSSSSGSSNTNCGPFSLPFSVHVGYSTSSATQHRRLLNIVGYSTSSVTQHRQLLNIVGY